MSSVKENDTIKVHYTGKLVTGEVFDSSLEREPLEVQLGQGKLIPGFEQGLIDMAVNEKKTITIEKKDAYGDVDNNMFQKVLLAQLPKEIKPEVGMGLLGSNPDGSQQQFRVAEVQEDHIIVDANHPLAGQDLIFELELIAIN